MWETERLITRTQQYRANPNPTAAFDLVAGILPTYYKGHVEPLVVDKCRAWGTPGNLRMLRTYVGGEIRIVCLVRPVIEVLASFISLVHKNPAGSILDQMLPESFRPVDDVRCDALMSPGGDIDRALWSVHNLSQPENEGLARIVTYAELTADPLGTLAGIESFLALDAFTYDLDHIVNDEPEDDSVYGLSGMHDVRPSISASSTRPEQILSDYVLNKYGHL